MTNDGSRLRFHDDTAIVTGAASGIGLAATELFASEGAHVVAADIDSKATKKSPNSLSTVPGSVTFTELDVTDYEAFAATVDAVVDEHGALDILVNNAGIARVGDLEDTSIENRDALVDVNINGVWNGCRAAIEPMKVAGSGSIINISSSGGLLGTPKLATYALTKAAVVNFTRALAGEAGPNNVRVNSVCPGTIETSLSQSVMDEQADPKAARESAAGATVFDRLGTPGEVADAIAFLASDEASFITGHALAVDGGASAILRSR